MVTAVTEAQEVEQVVIMPAQQDIMDWEQLDRVMRVQAVTGRILLAEEVAQEGQKVVEEVQEVTQEVQEFVQEV